MKHLARSLILWSVVTSAAFLAVGSGAARVDHAVRWYQACERVVPAQEWQRRGEICAQFAVRSN